MLAETMTKLENGEINESLALSISKLASQINNSFYAETRAILTQWQMKQEVNKLGSTPLFNEPMTFDNEEKPPALPGKKKG